MLDPILDHDLISQRYFFPQSQPLPDATFVNTSGGRLACWRSAPPSDRPVLVHFHGNGELVHHWKSDFVHWVQQNGYEVFLAEYRGYGGSEGIPRLAAMLDDVKAIVEAVGVPPERLLAFGRSIGSLYATEMVTQFPATAGLVLESGISDLLERLLLRVHPHELKCTEPEMVSAVASRFDQTKKISDYGGPSLFLHAEHDHLVGIHHAVKNHGAARSEDSQLVRFPKGDHNSILAANAPEYLRHLAAFMARIRTP